jgi:hypothetical protein
MQYSIHEMLHCLHLHFMYYKHSSASTTKGLGGSLPHWRDYKVMSF